MQTINYDLPTLLKRVREGGFQIPQFQRPFTWRESQVKLLVDSITRNYPIGSLLVMSKNPDLKLNSRQIEVVLREIDDSPTETEVEQTGAASYYVLDGQQRLTSAARVFLNANSKNTYYIDLKLMYEEFQEDDANWIKTKKKVQQDRERLNNNRLLRADIVLEQQKADVYVSEYFEDSEDYSDLTKDERRQASAKIKGYFEIIRKYQIPVVVLEGDTGVESICRVFETINSTGTKLTTFDLAVARFYPEPDLRELLRQSEEKHSILTEFNVEGDRVLQVLALWRSHENQTNPEPSRSDLLNLKSNFISENWDEAAKNLAETFEWAKNNGARADTMLNSSILVSISAFRIIHPQIFKKPQHNFNSVLKRWFFTRMLVPGARAASNYRIGRDFVDLVAYAEKNSSLEFPEIRFTVESLIALNKPSDNRFKAIQCLMAMTAREDLLTGQSLKDAIEHHHIFPRALSVRKTNPLPKDKIESIINRIAITQETNRTLSDRHPKDYFKDLQTTSRKNGVLNDASERLTTSLIPGNIQDDGFSGSFVDSKFVEFLNLRANMVLERIRQIIGNSLNVSNTDEESEDAQVG